MKQFLSLITMLLLPMTDLLAQSASRDGRIKPEQLGLPPGAKRTSEPFVTRIYKTDANGTILKQQPKGYPFTITKDYELKEDEDWRTHQGVDFSSKPSTNGKPTPLDFKAGVYGRVVKAGDGPWGTITVQIHDGTLIQYLHTTASHMEIGDIVAPDTKLGVTGRVGAGDIHLHIQAKDKFGLGQKKLMSQEKPDKELLEFDPDTYSPVKSKVIGRVVAVAKPETKWVVEVIGAGGKVDLVLGDFFDFQSAQRRLSAGAQNRPRRGAVKIGHFEEPKIRRLSFTADPAVGGGGWRINSKWPWSIPSSRCISGTGPVGGLLGRWAFTAIPWLATCDRQNRPGRPLGRRRPK